MKLQLRELKATRPTMPSQGLGPRQSVLPLLISFLFSHIVLTELSFPSPPPSSHPPPSPVLSLPIILFPPPFFFSRFPFTSFLVVSLYLPACALSRTVGIRACDSRREGGSSYSRFSPQRFPPFAIDSRDDVTPSRESTLVDSVELHITILSVVKSM